MPDGRNGKCKRPEARIILQVPRNGRETSKARTDVLGESQRWECHGTWG